MNYCRYGTSKCVNCGKSSFQHSGHLKLTIKGALGIPFQVNVLAGWCSDECHDSSKSNELGCYGDYDEAKHGILFDVFEKMWAIKKRDDIK
jgi:hypothetical protein